MITANSAGTISSRQSSTRVARWIGSAAAARPRSRCRPRRACRSGHPAFAGDFEAARSEAAGDVGEDQGDDPEQQQRPGPARAPAGQRDHADDQREHEDVAERIGERDHHLLQGAAGRAVGDELEDEGSAEGAGAEGGDQPVDPEPPVERARAGADHQQDRGRGQRVEGELAEVGRTTGTAAWGCFRRRPSSRARPRPRRVAAIISQAARSRPPRGGPQQAGDGGAEDDRVVEGAVEEVPEPSRPDPTSCGARPAPCRRKGRRRGRCAGRVFRSSRACA